MLHHRCYIFLYLTGIYSVFLIWYYLFVVVIIILVQCMVTDIPGLPEPQSQGHVVKVYKSDCAVYCTNPASANGGNPCKGITIVTKRCRLKLCTDFFTVEKWLKDFILKLVSSDENWERMLAGGQVLDSSLGIGVLPRVWIPDSVGKHTLSLRTHLRQ